MKYLLNKDEKLSNKDKQGKICLFCKNFTHRLIKEYGFCHLLGFKIPTMTTMSCVDFAKKEIVK